MATAQWKSITSFRLEEIAGPVAGKWESLFDELARQLPTVEPPSGLAIEFEDIQTAKRAGAAMIKLFKERCGAGSIKTAVRDYKQKPSLLVWQGEAWGGVEVAVED